MNVTKHARDRWAERFPGLDISTEFMRARYRVGKKLRKAIREASPNHTQYCSRTFKGRYFRMTRDRIVFVITPPETIITVLDLRQGKLDEN